MATMVTADDACQLLEVLRLLWPCEHPTHRERDKGLERLGLLR